MQKVLEELKGEKKTEVAAIDPVSAMGRLDNQGLLNIANQVQSKLNNVINRL